MTPEHGAARSVGLPRVMVAVTVCNGCMRNDHYVVQLRPDSAIRSSLASGLGRERRGLSDLIGCHPKHESDHRMVTLSPEALIGRPVSRSPCHAIRFGQVTLKSFMGRRNTATVVIWGDQINPHAPQFRTVPDPLHEIMFPDSG